MTFRKTLLSHVAAASLAGAVGLGTAALPTDVLAEWVEVDLENDDTPPLNAVDHADRAAARALAAVNALWPEAKEEAEALAKNLARAESKAVRIGAAAALGRILELASPVERVELVCRWAISDQTCERVAVARALGLSIPVFVSDLVIAELAHDGSAEVRAASVRALRAHLHEDPAGFGEVLDGLVRDPEPMVRRAARALQSAMTA